MEKNIISFINEIYDTNCVIGINGTKYPLKSAIDPEEGQFLLSIISSDPSITKTLEIGCKYALSSLHICLGIYGRNNAKHLIIDPFEYTRYNGVGIGNLEQCGIDYYEFIEEMSEIALPNLLKEYEGKIDFIFIDGNHTFDHALLDCFYSTRLLRVGGILAIDDVGFPSINRVVRYFQNYPCYELFGSVGREKNMRSGRKILRILLSPFKKSLQKIFSPLVINFIFSPEHVRLVALKKIIPDKCDSNWHDDFF